MRFSEFQIREKATWWPAWKAWLPLLALIICSTISAAPRACSLACWYRIFCFSISFSWQAKWRVQLTRMLFDSWPMCSSSLWVTAYLKGLFFTLFFFLFLVFCTALQTRAKFQNSSITRFWFFQLDNWIGGYLCHHVCICNIQRVFFQVTEKQDSQAMITHYKRVLKNTEFLSVLSSMLSHVTLTSSLSERCGWSEV